MGYRFSHDTPYHLTNHLASLGRVRCVKSEVEREMKMSCLTPSFQYLIACSMTRLTQDGCVNPDVGVNPIYSAGFDQYNLLLYKWRSSDVHP